MATYNKPQRPVLPTPANMTLELANTIVDAKVAFFSNVFTKDDVLAHPKSVYSTIINSPSATGLTLEQELGSENAKLELSNIMFRLTTGCKHT